MRSYHGDILLERMEDELKACKPLKRANLWSRWAGFLNRDDAINEILHKAEVAKHIFVLWNKYPPCQEKGHAGRYSEEDDVPEEDLEMADSLPDLITKHLSHFVTRYEAEYIDVMVKRYIKLEFRPSNNNAYSYDYTTIVTPHNFHQLPQIVSFESYRRLYLEFYSKMIPRSFSDQYSTLVLSVADAIQQNYGWDKYAIFVDDVCKAVFSLSPDDLTRAQRSTFMSAKWSCISRLLSTMVKYYSNIEDRVTKKKITREAAEAKYLLLDEYQVKLVKRLWAEYEKLDVSDRNSKAREIFNMLNYLPKTTSLVLELVWPVIAEM